MVGSLTRSNRNTSLSAYRPEIELENYFVEECNGVRDDDTVPLQPPTPPDLKMILEPTSPKISRQPPQLKTTIPT